MAATKNSPVDHKPAGERLKGNIPSLVRQSSAERLLLAMNEQIAGNADGTVPLVRQGSAERIFGPAPSVLRQNSAEDLQKLNRTLERLSPAMLLRQTSAERLLLQASKSAKIQDGPGAIPVKRQSSAERLMETMESMVTNEQKNPLTAPVLRQTSAERLLSLSGNRENSPHVLERHGSAERIFGPAPTVIRQTSAERLLLLARRNSFEKRGKGDSSPVSRPASIIFGSPHTQRGYKIFQLLKGYTWVGGGAADDVIAEREILRMIAQFRAEFLQHAREYKEMVSFF